MICDGFYFLGAPAAAMSGTGDRVGPFPFMFYFSKDKEGDSSEPCVTPHNKPLLGLKLPYNMWGGVQHR